MEISKRIKQNIVWLVLTSLILSVMACAGGTTIQATRPAKNLTPQEQSLQEIPTATRLSSVLPKSSLPTATQPPTPTPVEMTVETIEIPAPSLRDNLLGTSDRQKIQIVLPPSYDRSNLHYPVVYFLPGFGGSPDEIGNYYTADQIGPLMVTGQVNEMILVVPNGANLLGGSFYVNSPVTGNWEDYILKDVIGYVDEHYRTIRAPEGRGIAGHSMGGYAAFHLAMRYPDIFGAAYLLSAGLLGEKGLADFHVLNPERRVLNFIKIMQDIHALKGKAVLEAMGKLDGPNALAMAYGTAFSPDPEAGPPYFDYPYKEKNEKAVKDPKAWALWEDGMGNLKQKVQDYHDNLVKLSGIAIDYARQDRLDWIPRGSDYLASLLTETGIPNEVYSYDGEHGDLIPERIAQVMLPFMSRALVGPR
ncbi:MAG: putative esterase [Chloroflexi bacterium]|nr:putative esterase [Chloroflexota bacterium]